jgi:hypothetical protein
MVYRA